MDNTIRVERAKLDISQQDLAEKVNVSRQTIHSIERGKKIPSVELAIKIAQFFKVSVEEIFLIK
jgi:putative transcriptional regulator